MNMKINQLSATNIKLCLHHLAMNKYCCGKYISFYCTCFSVIDKQSKPFYGLKLTGSDVTRVFLCTAGFVKSWSGFRFVVVFLVCKLNFSKYVNVVKIYHHTHKLWNLCSQYDEEVKAWLFEQTLSLPRSSSCYKITLTYLLYRL